MTREEVVRSGTHFGSRLTLVSFNREDMLNETVTAVVSSVARYGRVAAPDEHHQHAHTHEALAHEHEHIHEEHHQHAHGGRSTNRIPTGIGVSRWSIPTRIFQTPTTQIGIEVLDG